MRILPSNTGGARRRIMMISYIAATSKIAWSSEDQTGVPVTPQTITVVFNFLHSPKNLTFYFRAAS